jgi:peptide/nickel transport system permease protein
MTTTARTIGPSSRAEDATQESQVKVVFRRFRRHRLAVISLILLLFIFVTSLLAPVITVFPRDAIDVSSSARPAPPGVVSRDGRSHVLGVDHLGRDLFTRVLYAARVSLTIAFLVVLISESFGMMLGAVAGFYGGRVDLLL